MSAPIQAPLIHDFTESVNIGALPAATRFDAAVPMHLRGSVCGAYYAAYAAAEDGALRRDPYFGIESFGYRITLAVHEDGAGEPVWNYWEAELVGVNDPAGMPVGFPIEIARRFPR